jgi:hypothetical protein
MAAITSSAMAMSDGGTSMPRSLAVCRLMTSSNGLRQIAQRRLAARRTFLGAAQALSDLLKAGKTR